MINALLKVVGAWLESDFEEYFIGIQIWIWEFLIEW